MGELIEHFLLTSGTRRTYIPKNARNNVSRQYGCAELGDVGGVPTFSETPARLPLLLIISLIALVRRAAEVLDETSERGMRRPPIFISVIFISGFME